MEATLTDRVLGGRYRMGELLGRGGMADVYDAVDARLGRPVAVKVLRAAMAGQPEVRRRFEDEARAAARLSHPNVVAVFDTGEDSGVPYIVMERLSGRTLHERVATGPLDTGFVVRLAGDVLGALAAAHDAGIVHRDVKPGNILLDDAGCAKVADFGIAKSAEAVGDATTTGMLLGTPQYLAPERFDGLPATPESDLYSVGLVLYEALTGTHPFTGETPVAVAYAVQHAPVRPLAEARPDLPGHLAAAVDRAMSRDPARRFRSAEQMAEALGALGVLDEDDPTVAIAPATTAWAAGGPDPTDAALARRPNRRSPWGRPTALILGIGLAALLLILLLGGAGDREGGAPAATEGAAPKSPLVVQLEDLATRVRTGDGPRGPEASDRLRAVASELHAGGDAGPEATALMADALRWNQAGDLGDTATSQTVALLSQVPGADRSVAVTTAPPARDDDEGEGEGKGKGKGKGDD